MPLPPACKVICRRSGRLCLQGSVDNRCACSLRCHILFARGHLYLFEVLIHRTVSQKSVGSITMQPLASLDTNSVFSNLELPQHKSDCALVP
eukprot:5756697-Amphidinium_carterae.1